MRLDLSTDPVTAPSPCVVVAVDAAPALSAAGRTLDAVCAGALAAALADGDFSGTSGKTLLLRGLAGSPAPRIVLVGTGKAGALDEGRYQRVVASACQAVAATGAREATLHLAELEVAGRDVEWKLRMAATVATRERYRYSGKQSEDDQPPRLEALHFALGAGTTTPERAARALREGEAIGAGINRARELGNLPANVCTPGYLAEQAEALGREHGLEVQVLDKAAMRELGMGALLAVAQGTRQPPRLIVVHYRGGPQGAPPVVLVGKGVTFDSGGISIKPAASMDEMKFDMCGAAAVLGTLEVAARLALPLNLIGIVPASENLPGGGAVKPGDVVRSMAGKTIEILNTDAEGRLLLCDALTYAARFEPDVVIDVATLTGACVVALGGVVSGLFSNDRELADALLDAGRAAHDRAWELPLLEDYKDTLKSNFADLPNVGGGREGGAITAATFLAAFTERYRWAHLDIAGTAWKGGREKGATGRPVGLLAHYLMARAHPR
jgi:leucyl aminopeptidase